MAGFYKPSHRNSDHLVDAKSNRMFGAGDKQATLAGFEHCGFRARVALLRAQSRVSHSSAIESKALCRDWRQSAALVIDSRGSAVGLIYGRLDSGTSDAGCANFDDAEPARENCAARAHEFGTCRILVDVRGTALSL